MQESQRQKQLHPKEYYSRVPSKMEEYNQELRSSNFNSILIYICKAITTGDLEGRSLTLNKCLYYILNMPPLFERQKSVYNDIIRNGITASSLSTLQEQLVEDLKKLMPCIKKVPIEYDKPEEDLAKLHFSGAFGNGIPNPTAYEFECSKAVREFDIEAYKQIRGAFTVEELERIESNTGKFSVLYILTGYYISEYCNLIAGILQRAQIYYMPRSHHFTVQQKLEWAFANLDQETYKSVLDAEGSNPPSKEVRMSLITKKYCNNKIKSKVCTLLDGIRNDFKIGSLACSKRDFCNIVFVFTKYMSVYCWKVQKYATNRHLLSRYYGMQEPKYKISECKDFEKSEEGKQLINKIQVFCAKYEGYL